MSKSNTLHDHLTAVLKEKRRFENVYQSLNRMFIDGGIEKKTVNGNVMLDYQILRQSRKHIVGLYHETNELCGYIRDAARGGSTQEMAFVLVGEPGNGKTYLVETVCRLYRQFLALPENMRYTFRFVNMSLLEKHFGQGLDVMMSQTYEDPMILALNIFNDEAKTADFFKASGFSTKKIDRLFQQARPLGACSEYTWNLLRDHYDNDVEKMLGHIQVVPVTLSESLGTMTGKYSAKDKITSSSVDLLGEESIQRMLHMRDTLHPYKFDLNRGALGRVAGGGIHFADELFKNKPDLIQIYLGVIQNRTIEIDGFKWPMDCFVVATSNNAEFDRFKNEKQQAPIVDRCRICNVAHCTNYKEQPELTRYALGTAKLRNYDDTENIHEDPNLIGALSIAAVLTRLPYDRCNDRLTWDEMLKLAAGDVGGEKSIKVLSEIIEELNADPNISNRFGQKGLGQRNVGRAIQLLIESPKTNEGKCAFAYDIFKCLKRVILDYITDANDRQKYLEDINNAKSFYRDSVMVSMFNAYMDEPHAIRKDVMDYINIIVGLNADDVGEDQMWSYVDPQTGKEEKIKIDERYINSVEERLGLKTKEQRESYRTSMRRLYGQKIPKNPNYDFMDQQELVKAVTDVRLKSDIAGASSLVGALANRSNEENQKLYDRMLNTMRNKLGYCKTCAQKTIEYFCTQDDE